MKKWIFIIGVFLSFCCTSQTKKVPFIKNSEKHDQSKLMIADSTYYLNFIQYIGKYKSHLKIAPNTEHTSNKILKNNYCNDSIIHNKQKYNNETIGQLEIVADPKQTTPIVVNISDLKDEEYDLLNEGKEIKRKINYSKQYYDAFPIIFINKNPKESVLGFGNHIPYTLEALDKNKEWKTIKNNKGYNSGTGIKYIFLKPDEVAIAYQLRLNGSFETKLRIKLGNNYSNEFVGKIDEKLFSKN